MKLIIFYGVAGTDKTTRVQKQIEIKLMPAKDIKFWWALVLWDNLFFICRKKSMSVEVYKI